MTPKPLKMADLFCGAGGTSTGAVEAALLLNYRPQLTAINHWPVAVATHTLNHPHARHLCASLDSLNPRTLFRRGELDLLWASPECTHHSQARGGAPINDQSRATAWCVTRWAEALRPKTILVENVPEFKTWGPVTAAGKRIKRLAGRTFNAWLESLSSLGYRIGHAEFMSADYGDPTTRNRLFVQAQLGPRRVCFPDPTHAEDGSLLPWVPARAIIDWDIPMQSIFRRRKPLAKATLRKIAEGLEAGGGAFIIAMEHGGRVLPVDKPLPTITTAKGGAFGLAYVLGQHGGAKLRSCNQPLPTVAAAGAISLIVEYYGNGRTHSVDRPLPSVTTKDRFALIKAEGGDVLFRMLKWPELARAQGFRRDYQFTGNVQERTKQIGNAVTRRMARAHVLAAIGQRSDIRHWLAGKEEAA